MDLLHVHQEILAWLAYGTGQLGCFFIWWSIELKDIYSVAILAQVFNPKFKLKELTYLEISRHL